MHWNVEWDFTKFYIFIITVIILVSYLINGIKSCFHFHKYELIQTTDIVDEDKAVIGVCHVSRCIHCGKIKYTKFDTKVK